MKRLTNRGETIVEVLIVMLILTSVMTSAFVITTHTLNQDRSSQERTEAAAIAQGQIERLSAAVQNAGAVAITPDTYFCLKSDLGAVDILAATISDVGNYPVDCQDGRYSNYLQFDVGTGIYTETVQWNNATGAGVDNLHIVYRPVYLSANDSPEANMPKWSFT